MVALKLRMPRWLFGIVLILGFCLSTVYLFSLGVALRCYVWLPTDEAEAVLRIHRPLFVAAPNTMGKYAQWCGWSDLDAFFLVQSMMVRDGRMGGFDINVQPPNTASPKSLASMPIRQ